MRVASQLAHLMRLSDVVQRRVLEDVFEVRLLVRIAKVRAPRVPDRELVETEHIHHSGVGIKWNL